MEKEKFPISKKGKEKGSKWEFVKEAEGTYKEVVLEALKLQKEDKGYQYRIWDCR